MERQKTNEGKQQNNVERRGGRGQKESLIAECNKQRITIWEVRGRKTIDGS